MENLWTILSSAGVAAVVSAVASYIISLLMQKRKYKDDYYKMVISKRMEAYEYVEKQIAVLKLIMADEDGKTYPMMFGGGVKEFYEGQESLSFAMTHSLWLSEDMADALNVLQQDLLILSRLITDDAESNIALGKEWCQKLRQDRKVIEECLKKDMLTLYQVSSFLHRNRKSKRKTYFMPTDNNSK